MVSCKGRKTHACPLLRFRYLPCFHHAQDLVISLWLFEMHQFACLSNSHFSPTSSLITEALIGHVLGGPEPLSRPHTVTHGLSQPGGLILLILNGLYTGTCMQIGSKESCLLPPFPLGIMSAYDSWTSRAILKPWGETHQHAVVGKSSKIESTWVSDWAT